MLLSEYINDLNENKIKTHRDALKYFPVRYSSFNNQSYAKDCTLPACTLAQYGFYYDECHKLIRCFECDFEYSDLEQGLLTTILHKHHKHCTDCSQILFSLENFLDNNVELLGKSRDLSERSVVRQVKTSLVNECYKNLENRINSFDNVRIQLGKRDLSENGFYRVLLKDTLSRKRLEKSEIEQIARHAPSLIHIRCAFCTYECLISKNGSLSTTYKCPVQEHQQKSANTCFIFTSEKQADTPLNNNANELEWLQYLLRLDNRDGCNALTLNDIVMPNLKNPNDLIVTKIPRAIDQIILLETSKNKSLIYVPQKYPANSNDLLSDTTTSDFNKLQSVLSLSDNVISEKAYHPAFKMHHVRLDSFKVWPGNNSQKPADLARAGFYYFGIKDMVKCFFCNGGLKDWSAGDDVYEDHVRWFPKCQFIRQLMGPEYVEKIKEKFKNKDSGFATDELTTTNTIFNGFNKIQTQPKPNDKNISQPLVFQRTLNAVLDTNILKRVIDADISTKSLIRQAIEQDMTSECWTNKCNPGNMKSAIELAKLAIELGEAIEKKAEDLQSISHFLISNLMACVGVEDVRALLAFQFGVIVANVRMLREYGSFETRCVALVCLDRRDEHLVEKIVGELDQKYFLPNKVNEQVQVVKTNWCEFEEKFESFQANQAPVVPETTNPTTNPNNQIVLDDTQRPDLCPVILKETVEKRTNELMEENERLKSERLCVVCLTKDKNVLFLPCAHLSACLECSFNMQQCPLCRSKIQATVRTYS